MLALVIGWIATMVKTFKFRPLVLIIITIHLCCFLLLFYRMERESTEKGCIAPNLRSRPTRGWGNNQGLSSLSCKLSTGLTGGVRAKKPQDGFRALEVHWMEIWVLSFQCNSHSNTIQLCFLKFTLQEEWSYFLFFHVITH